MYLTLALVVFFAAIITFFSQEFIRLFKKIFAIWGAKTVLPLLLASWIIYTFDYWVMWIIYYCRELLYGASSGLAHIVPSQNYGYKIAMILLLTFLSVVPVLLLDLLSKRRTYRHYPYPYLTSSIIFITTALILLVI